MKAVSKFEERLPPELDERVWDIAMGRQFPPLDRAALCNVDCSIGEIEDWVLVARHLHVDVDAQPAALFLRIQHHETKEHWTSGGHQLQQTS